MAPVGIVNAGRPRRRVRRGDRPGRRAPVAATAGRRPACSRPPSPRRCAPGATRRLRGRRRCLRAGQGRHPGRHRGGLRGGRAALGHWERLVRAAARGGRALRHGRPTTYRDQALGARRPSRLHSDRGAAGGARASCWSPRATTATPCSARELRPRRRLDRHDGAARSPARSAARPRCRAEWVERRSPRRAALDLRRAGRGRSPTVARRGRRRRRRARGAGAARAPALRPDAAGGARDDPADLGAAGGPGRRTSCARRRGRPGRRRRSPRAGTRRAATTPRRAPGASPSPAPPRAAARWPSELLDELAALPDRRLADEPTDLSAIVAACPGWPAAEARPTRSPRPACCGGLAGPGGRLPARQAGGEDPARGHPGDRRGHRQLAARRLVHRRRACPAEVAARWPWNRRSAANSPRREHRRHARGRRPQLPAARPVLLRAARPRLHHRRRGQALARRAARRAGRSPPSGSPTATCSTASSRRDTATPPQPVPRVDRRADPRRRLRLGQPRRPGRGRRAGLARRPPHATPRNGVYGGDVRRRRCARSRAGRRRRRRGARAPGCRWCRRGSRLRRRPYGTAVADAAGASRLRRGRRPAARRATATCTGCTRSTTPR